MPKLDDLFAPFQKAAALFVGNGSYQMVPFAQWEVRNQLHTLSPPRMPPLNLTSVPGLTQIIRLIPGAGSVLDDFGNLIDDVAHGHLEKLVPDFARLVPDTIGFVSHQLGLGLSLGALLKEVATPGQVAESVLRAYQSYFFGDGFLTLEGGSIEQPSFDIGADSSNPTLAQIASQVRKFASRKTADHYLRDLIRLTVESAADQLFSLPTRYKRLVSRNDELGKVQQQWFKGFASLAESTVTCAVEQAAQGVSTFSTNPLIAAALATFAGTSARKATQNAFLVEVNILAAS
jgi:hypothetical protein